MAKFLENILKKEEEFGGYNVGEPDDDIFQNKDKQYPDDINDYVYSEPEIVTPDEIIENQQKIPKETQETIDKQEVIEDNSEVITPSLQKQDNINVWDSFDNESPQDVSAADNLENEINSQIIEEENHNNSGDFTEKDNIQDNDNEQNTSIELDDDFKRQLAEQLASKKAKQLKNNNVEIQDPEPINQEQKFVPIEESENVNYYDLSEFDNARPSEKINDNSSQQIKEIDNKVENINQNEKKKKNKFIWIFISSVAALILLLGIAYLIMYYFIPNYYNHNQITQKDSTTKLEKNITKHESTTIDTINKKNNIIDTTNNIDKKAEKITEKEVQRSTNKEVINNIKKELASEFNKSKIENHKKETISIKKEEKVIAKNKIQANTDNMITIKNKIVKENTKKPEVVTKDITKPQIIKEEKIINAIYTIQVYSSPSKEDATDWVNRLKNKNLNATISEQMIRDVKWYRVRFGTFQTREEAKAVALRYGFSQTWVDRIK